MGTSLTGKNISATYLGLLKTTDNAVIGGTAKIITDGNGTDSPLYLSTTRLGIGITPTSTLHVNGDANINTSFAEYRPIPMGSDILKRDVYINVFKVEKNQKISRIFKGSY